MRNSLLAIVLSLFAFSPASAQEFDWGPVIKKLENATVYLSSGCSGAVINETKKFVLTANHCLPEEGPLFADLVRADVVASDAHQDLAVLEIKHLNPERKALKLADKNPKIGDTVMAGGYGYAFPRLLFRKSMISDTKVRISDSPDSDFIASDAPYIGGMSGSVVVNQNGEIVLIVQRSSSSMGIGIGAELIRERVGRFWDVK